VVFEGVARIEHGGDPALRPGGRAAGQRALGQHQHLAAFSASASAAVSPAAPEPTMMTSCVESIALCLFAARHLPILRQALRRKPRWSG
jgi:hypothetical protein